MKKIRILFCLILLFACNSSTKNKPDVKDLIAMVRYEQTNKEWSGAGEQAAEAKKTIIALLAAYNKKFSLNSESESDQVVLDQIVIDSRVTKIWTFAIIASKHGIISIVATSTGGMLDGAGKQIVYEVDEDEWSGYSIDEPGAPSPQSGGEADDKAE